MPEEREAVSVVQGVRFEHPGVGLSSSGCARPTGICAMYKGLTCGAVLGTERWVGSAAHCEPPCRSRLLPSSSTVRALLLA